MCGSSCGRLRFTLWGRECPSRTTENDRLSTIICPVAVTSATFPSNKRGPFCVKAVAILLRRDGTNKQRTSKVDKTEYIPHFHTSHKATLGVSFQDSVPNRQSVPARCFRTCEPDPKMRESLLLVLGNVGSARGTSSGST